jgi:hypothetical protein
MLLNKRNPLTPWLMAAVCGLPATPAFGQAFEFEEPVRLKAAGAIIDTGEHVAHSGPALADLNADGRMDLLVGNFRGTIEYFQNIGFAEAPEFDAGRMLQAEGQTITVENW